VLALWWLWNDFCLFFYLLGSVLAVVSGLLPLCAAAVWAAGLVPLGFFFSFFFLGFLVWAFRGAAADVFFGRCSYSLLSDSDVQCFLPVCSFLCFVAPKAVCRLSNMMTMMMMMMMMMRLSNKRQEGGHDGRKKGYNHEHSRSTG